MNIISLFAGCGGLDLGFERAGFNVIWANECDSSIFETYRKNHPNTMLNTTDVRLLKDQDIPSCDGVIGGPPCQAWSEGGKQLGCPVRCSGKQKLKSPVKLLIQHSEI